ncbi:uncharacterized protein LOC133198951 [Saccostrea echinata]|uniref:uncharacterized protein LOC133198951 n=1 Tax=Saccostrea echinata TaxID=191078 RepID=UPI002A83F95D|nr:uncharacterized protein LOC133198951 [Saccostrea echinata]
MTSHHIKFKMASTNNSSEASDSASDIDLHMSFEASSFEETQEEHFQNVAPYRFEPEASDSSESDGSSEDDVDNPQRLGNTDWYDFHVHLWKPTLRESICCTEITRIDEKRTSYQKELPCITEHPGFQSVCLDIYVLETAYYQYRSQYGELQKTIEQRNRYTAYRQLVRWCWGYLGKSVRVPLPSCAVTKIHHSFSSEEYQGFRDPE